jgi:hypothetical protein
MKKIKSKVVKSTINNKDILETFQELLGTSESNVCLPIAYPKYTKLQINVSRYIKLMNMFHSSSCMNKFPDINTCFEQYIKSLEKHFAEAFTAPDLEQYCTKETETLAGPNYSFVPKEVKAEFSKIFNSCKKCNIVNIIIVTCKNLIMYKKFIGDKNNLNDNFLTKKAGNVFDPLPDFPQLNIKKIYNDDILDKNEKNFILIFLSKLYEISYSVYETLSSPDVDVNEFVAVILNSIDTVKKHIPRCDEAFDKIVESVDVLKDNFGGYYKDFMASNNPAIIMENFVFDVSKNTKATPKVTAQFRKIITYYREIATKHAIHDPRLQSLFKHVDRNFEELERFKKDEETYYEESEIKEEEEIENNNPLDCKEEIKKYNDFVTNSLNNLQIDLNDNISKELIKKNDNQDNITKDKENSDSEFEEVETPQEE